jgi:hypothetical protein
MTGFPIIFNLVNSVLDDDCELLLKAYRNLQGTGNFNFVNTEKIEEVLNNVEKEILLLPFEVIPEDGMIKYAQTITGYRDDTFYIFKINIENSINKKIMDQFPNWVFYRLNFINEPNCLLYFFLNQKDLSLFGELFSSWLTEIDPPFYN